MKENGVLLVGEELRSAIWGKIESSRIPMMGSRQKDADLQLPVFNSRNGLLGLTTQRVIFYMPKMMGRYEFEAYEIDQVDSIIFTKGMRKGRINVSIVNNDRVIKGIDNTEGKTIVEHIQTAIQENKRQRQDGGASASQNGSNTQSPMDILKTKFVNGEITEEEFERKKKLLE